MQQITKSNALGAWVLLGGLLLPQLQGAESLRDNIVVILDASSSMKKGMSGGRRKMDVAKKALREVLVNSVKDTTNVGILVFSSSNLKSDVLYPLGPVDKDRLARVVMSPQPGRGTPLGRYLKKGADVLLEQRQKQEGYGTYRLLVVTDGEAQDPKLVDVYLPDILSRGITIDVIGVAMKSDHPLATRVHSYRSADDPARLAEAISEVFAEIGGEDEDMPGSEDFTLLETIPDDLAKAMLKALTERRDEPITAVRRSSTTTPRSAPRRPSSGWGPVGIVMMFVFLLFVVKRVKSIGRRYRG